MMPSHLKIPEKNSVTEPSDQVVLGFEYLQYQENDAIKTTGQKTPLPGK